MEIRYEKDLSGNFLLTDCPNDAITIWGEKIKINSKPCQKCDNFDGYQNSKQMIFCKYGEKE